MRILILGGAGMIGQKLVRRLASDGQLGGKDIRRITLHDIVAPEPIAGAPFPIDIETGDISMPGEAQRLLAPGPDLVYHLAAVVSGEAEADFEKGYWVNLDGTRAIFEAVRRAGTRPRVVFTSSLAVYGAPFPTEVIAEDYQHTPLTSYGTQKAMCELLLADYTRRGAFDGIGLRLTNVSVRPGKPNKAASGFFSNIIREPLNGEEASLPVPESVRQCHASPRSVTGFLVHAATIDTALIGPRRNLSMPGVATTVGGQIEALRKVAGERVAARVKSRPDPFITQMVSGWPTWLDATRAKALGFKAEETYEEIIRAHIEDELGGVIK